MSENLKHLFMQKKSILILGSGAREAAFAYQFANDGSYHVYVAPGNCLIGTLPNTELVPLSPTIENFQKLVNFVIEKDIRIVLPGPEYIIRGKERKSTSK